MTAVALTSPEEVVRAVTTVPVDDVPELLGLLPADGALSWVRRGEGLVAWGEAARLEVSGPTALADAAAWWQEWLEATSVDDPLGVPGSGPVLFASIAFDPVGGTSVFVVPEVVVGRRDGVAWVTTTDTDADPRSALLAPPDTGDGPAPRLRYADGALDPVAVRTTVSPLDRLPATVDLSAVR